MINIVDNFLDDLTYISTYNKLLENDFEEVVVGDKSFWVQFSTPEFDKTVLDKVSSIEGKESLYSVFLELLQMS